MKSMIIASTSDRADFLLTNLQNLHQDFEVSYNIGNAKRELNTNVDLVLFDLRYFAGDIIQAISNLTALRNLNNLGFKLILLYDEINDSGSLAIDAVRQGVNAFVPDYLGDVDLSSRIKEVLATRTCLSLRKSRNHNVFVASPYSKNMDYMLDYTDGIKPVLQFLNLIDVGPIWYKGYGFILKKIIDLVHRAGIGIANVSPEYEKAKGILGKKRYWKTNPNVAFELGLMKQRGIPIIIICQEQAWSGNKEGVLSDIQGLELLIYESRIHLTCELIERLR